MVHTRFFKNNAIDRHIALTDGVYAIAMTILALEIAVPSITEITSGHLLQSYLTTYLFPTVIIYFISFLVVYNFWETSVILFSFKKLTLKVLSINMIALASVCLIPFATGFLFNFYEYSQVTLLFPALILIISIIYLVMLILIIRDNFSEIFKNKEDIKSKVNLKLNEGVVFPNLKIYMKGAILTVFYLALSPIITSILSILLAFVNPFLSILSFVLILILRLIIRMSPKKSSKISNLTENEKNFLKEIEESIYGD